MLSTAEQLPYLTVRIEAISISGASSTGTGFHFGIDVGDNKSAAIVVTNKHVVNEADQISTYISLADQNHNPITGKFHRIVVNDVGRKIFAHPDPSVDLAAFSLADGFLEMAKIGLIPFIRGFGAGDIPDPNLLKMLSPIEDIIMIGYPIGLRDEVNNMPIIRRGITATSYHIDYNGKKEFMIDCACFPGSSGSPVLIANRGVHLTANQGISYGEKFAFLGLLWGGPQFTAEGKIVVKPVPTNNVPVSRSAIPTNLGYCIKSSRVAELADMMMKAGKA
jgi:hypothetical protein